MSQKYKSRILYFFRASRSAKLECVKKVFLHVPKLKMAVLAWHARTFEYLAYHVTVHFVYSLSCQRPVQKRGLLLLNI